MYEVEVKVRADHAPVRERLAAEGAVRRGRTRQVDTYYDAPDRSFAETDEALRIRRETSIDGDDGDRPDGEGGADATDRPAGADPDRAVVTYKGPKVDDASKTREEVETPVDPGEMAAVLEGLGYDPVATVRKDRTAYELDGHVVVLDAVDGLGEFVEVETEVDREADVPDAREGVRALLRRLDLDPGAGIRTSYLGLLLSAGEGGPG